MSKETKIGNESRLAIKAGIDKSWRLVAPTLGAVGKSAIIEFKGLDPVIADDGKTVLLNLEWSDPYEQMGLQMYRKASIRTSEKGGDGTATTACLTHALIREAFAQLNEDGSNSHDIEGRLHKGLVEVLSELSKLKRDVTENDIERIATISSLDPEVAKLIAEVIKEIGVNGVVTVEKGSKIGYSKEVVKGARFDKGMISNYFINEPEQERTVLENPFIVLVDRKISTGEQIKSIMDSIHTNGNKSVLFIADDIDGLALASLIQSSKTVSVMGQNGQTRVGTYDITCVRNPFTGSRARDFLLDMASLTGGTMISEEAGMRLDACTIEQCGQAEKVIVTKDNCTIIGGKSSGTLESRITSLQSEIEQTTSEYVRSMLEDRLACLTGGIGVIRVGTYTDTEFNAKKYKFENAINATQAALKEGIVTGGGSALNYLSTIISDNIFKNVLKAPITQMMVNAGMKELPLFEDKETGINFKTKEKVNMFDVGIIDPCMVTRLALESAVGVATTLINIDPAIVNEKEEVNG